MSVDTVVPYLAQYGLQDRIKTFENSSATVALAAECVGCRPAQIAKTLSFKIDGNPLLIVAAGATKIAHAKYKALFHSKAVMLSPDEVETMLGLKIGGVCPFGVNAPVYLDVSLKRFDIVYPAAGDDHSAVRLTPEELQTAGQAVEWIDVCKGWSEE